MCSVLVLVVLLPHTESVNVNLKGPAELITIQTQKYNYCHHDKHTFLGC